MVSVGERAGLLPQAEFGFRELGDGMCHVQRRSIFSGRINSMVLPVCAGDVLVWRTRGTLVQDAFPHLDADQREFLMTGATPEEWAGIFGSGDSCEED